MHRACSAVPGFRAGTAVELKMQLMTGGALVEDGKKFATMVTTVPPAGGDVRGVTATSCKLGTNEKVSLCSVCCTPSTLISTAEGP